VNRNLRIVLPGIWQKRGVPARFLLPVSWVYTAIVLGRRRCYRSGWLPVSRFTRPVVVVGGITVGGSGKTPLTMYVARLLAEQGWSPGVVTRGYGGRPGRLPLRVEADTPVRESGDEAAVMARRLDVPVVVDPDRPRGVRWLIDELGCGVVVADDGLQHYAMDRQVEIAVVGGGGLGNGWCLPAGPLREPASRLQEVDIVVRNNGRAGPDEFGMALRVTGLTRLDRAAVQATSVFNGRRVHAVAGTGRPEGFFGTLRELGMEVEPHAFPDHYRYTASDFSTMGDAPIVMTEKDAVKCAGLPVENAWYADATAVPEDGFDQHLIELLKR